MDDMTAQPTYPLPLSLFLPFTAGPASWLFRAINLLLGVITEDRCVESSLT